MKYKVFLKSKKNGKFKLTKVSYTVVKIRTLTCVQVKLTLSLLGLIYLKLP